MVACARTGRSPPPVDDVRFETPAAAERAADAATGYHETLADLDPDRPRLRFVVYERRADALEVARTRTPTGERRENGLPRAEQRVTLSSGRDGEWLAMRNAPVVHLAHDDGPFEDAVVARQLESKL